MSVIIGHCLNLYDTRCQAGVEELCIRRVLINLSKAIFVWIGQSLGIDYNVESMDVC
jgi:hypothetical protein